MGGSSFSIDDWSRKSSGYKGKSLHDIYTTHQLLDDVDPKKIKNAVRESCDSDSNPNSTPIIIGLDFTGSMRGILTYIIQTGLGELFKEIYTRKPVSDPQVLFCGIGDAMVGDPAPFQVGQFESQCDLLTDGLEKFWIDGCMGGGNDMESYDLPYYFAATMTKTDAMLKRNQKGFLFTIGDEPPPETLTPAIIENVFGIQTEHNLPFKQLIKMVSQSYIPFHIIMSEGSHPASYGLDSVTRPWQQLLGENAIVCRDHHKLSEVIVSILEVKAGKDKAAILSSWDGNTALVVKEAIQHLPATTHEGLVF